ncbi:hypothetical protein ELQ90_15985 [Labedella phragmitis]|uniref:Uncharacterized protein n=1 Tax=Labedella phragmitis TaxID=2498849 RepID=A0A444PNR6_9MICO|nr:hypothetical protein [Labedella phragmitis]RWZ46128.1 hypothetical protein ELQ90_15985 [Labedella phragmitis]
MTGRRTRLTAILIVALFAPGVVSCASPSTMAEPAGGPSSTETTETPAGPDPESQAQAQAWLDAAVVPPGAEPTPGAPASFNSFTGWVCQPVAELEGYWTVPGMSVTAATNWLITNPTADLVTTAGEPWPEDQDVDGASVGYIPADGTHQGIVYTVVKMPGGSAIRAEVAALSENAVCPTPPDGGEWGLPGQG